MSKAETNRHVRATGWASAATWGIAFLTALILLASINRGFSGLDESYYLALIVDPTRFKSNLHAFGFPFHLLFLGLGQSIVALRVTGLVLLTCSGALLGYAVKRYCKPYLPNDANPPLVLLGGLFSLTEHVMWIPTPAYNALLSISGCVLLAGALSWLSNDRDRQYRSDWIASVAVGLGGCFSFFAKPPSAMLFAIGVALLLGLSRRWTSLRTVMGRVIIVGTTCVLPLILILHITVGLGRYLEMVDQTLTVLHFNNGPLELPGRTLGELAASPAVLMVSFAAPVAMLVSMRLRRGGATAPVVARWITGLWLGVTLAFMAARIAYRAAHHATPFLYVGMPMLAVTFATMAFAFSQNRDKPAPAFIGLLGILIAIPFMSAYGSANPILVQISMWLYGPLFALVLAGRAFFSARIARAVETMGAAYVLFAICLSAALTWGLPEPVYRQTERIALPFTSDTLLVDSQTARYVADLRRIADRGQLGADTPVLDLTGSSASTALLLNDRAPFLPWVFPMFEHSAEIADAIWDSMTPAEQRSAWIIAPIDPRFGRTRVATYLTHHRHAYRIVGTTQMNFGYIDGATQRITVWQPLTEVARPGR
ncbi:hypothetical protein AB5I39_07970 [Sphingomonas sp. MMS24-J45]|uniref:hypothetical protein n=1 Tax=Sphingomonas sp. MMS24-J45 TaxID=3238806 RepID=UPI00384FE75E